MEQLTHWLVVLTTSGVAAILIQIGRFVQKCETLRKSVDNLADKQEMMNGSVKDVITTVGNLPCEVEKRRESCPGSTE